MGQLTITTTTEQDQRIIAAYQAKIDPNGTGADIKTWLIDRLKQFVRAYETEVANEAASAAVTDIDPT